MFIRPERFGVPPEDPVDASTAFNTVSYSTNFGRSACSKVQKFTKAWTESRNFLSRLTKLARWVRPIARILVRIARLLSANRSRELSNWSILLFTEIIPDKESVDRSWFKLERSWLWILTWLAKCCWILTSWMNSARYSGILTLFHTIALTPAMIIQIFHDPFTVSNTLSINISRLSLGVPCTEKPSANIT